MLQLIKPLEEGDTSGFQLMKLEVVAETPKDLIGLINQYEWLFPEPSSLPPSRGLLDDRIPLQFGANPINVRLYRYPLRQRDVIEKLVQEILNQGIIQVTSHLLLLWC